MLYWKADCEVFLHANKRVHFDCPSNLSDKNKFLKKQLLEDNPEETDSNSLKNIASVTASEGLWKL